jgi:hypothetical protein
MPRSADTSEDAARVQYEIYRRMLPFQRFEQACRLTDSVRSLCEAGVRSLHPEFSDREVQLEVVRLTIGDALFRKVFPEKNMNV